MTAQSLGRGIAYMATYAVLQSLVWALVRILSQDLSTETLFFFRNFIGLLTILPLISKQRLDLFKTQAFMTHLWRALAAFTGGISIFYAVAHAPLGTVVAITFTAPLLASLVAVFLYKEPVTRAKLGSVLLGFAGVLLVARPTSGGTVYDGAVSGEILYGLGAALIAAIATAAAFLLVKRLSATEPSPTVLAYPFLLLLPLSAVVAGFNWTTPDTGHLLLLFLMGAGFSGAQYAMAQAFRYADASAVLPIDYLRLICASSIGMFYFGDTADIWVYLGAFLILVASVLTARKSR